MGPDRTDFQSVQMFLKEEKSPRTDFGQCYVYSLRIHHINFCFVKTPEPSGCNYDTYLPTQKEIQTDGAMEEFRQTSCVAVGVHPYKNFIFHKIFLSCFSFMLSVDSMHGSTKPRSTTSRNGRCIPHRRHTVPAQ